MPRSGGGIHLRIPNVNRSRASSPVPPGAVTSGSGLSGGGSGSNKASLLTRLNHLLDQLREVIEVVKNWPSSQDSQVHYDTTTSLMEALNRTVTALKEVEVKVLSSTKGPSVAKANVAISMADAINQAILRSPVPLDLLDLMDYGNGLNPEIFTKQLILEALRQLSGLRRRKEALELLGSEIEKGVESIFVDTAISPSNSTAVIKKEESQEMEESAASSDSTSRKRSRNLTEDGEVEDEDQEVGEVEKSTSVPAAKKTRGEE